MNRPQHVLVTAACAVLAMISLAHGQDASFTGVGQLPSGTSTRCNGISQDGTVVVGDAVSNGRTQAFLWTAGGGLRALGFLSQVNQESHATDVGVTSTGEIKICGYSKNDNNKNRAFLWTGDADGNGTFEMLPLLNGGAANEAYALHITNTDDVLVTGDSESLVNGSIRRQGFYWSTGEPDSEAIGFLSGGTPDSHGRGIGQRDGSTSIVGYANSRWSGGNNSREAATWSPNGLSGDKGLVSICDAEGWQILAGPNGVAETTASANDVQVTPVGTTDLDPNHVVVSAGPDNILKDQTNPSGDDFLAPLSLGTPSVNESLYRAVSPDGRYRVGRSNYLIGDNLKWEANLRDIRNRDYSSPDNCGGIAFHWPLGFVTVKNDGTPASDDYSEAFGVSNGASPFTSRNGLVVVGSSLNLADPSPRPTRAFICFVQDSFDIWFLRHAGADPDDYGAHVASRFKDMRNLQWLLSNDFSLDLTGWDLQAATAVSDDGTVVAGWGLHNGVAEGFVAMVPGPPPLGACCVTTGYSTGTCTETRAVDCSGDWLGPDTACGPNGSNCDFCPDPFADTDGDADVDLVDFALLQRCITSNGSPIRAGCSCFDTDDNGAIDQTDVERFILCGSGPEVAASADCDDGL